MSTTTVTQRQGFKGDAGRLARRLLGPARLAGLLGGLAMIVVMILVMGAAGISAGVIGGAIVYVILRWGLLPPVNPLMAFVPQIAFFLAHLLFGLVVGVVLAVAFRPPSVAGAPPASR